MLSIGTPGPVYSGRSGVLGGEALFVMSGGGCFQWIARKIGWNEENKMLQNAI